MKDYLKTRETGDLKSLSKQQQISRALQKAPISYSEDKFLHFGDKIILKNKKMDAVLCCDILDKISGLDEAYACTAA